MKTRRRPAQPARRRRTWMCFYDAPGAPSYAGVIFNAAGKSVLDGWRRRHRHGPFPVTFHS